MRSPRIHLAAIALGGLLLCAAAAGAQDTATEEFARRQYDSGLAFLRDQKFAEALKDFQAVVDQYPASRVADAALLRIAEYQLDVAGDIPAAQSAVDTLQKKYPTTESGPMALVLAGRITVTKSRAPADVESALASYERVPRLFPGSDAVPASIFYAAEALRITNRDAEAVLRYRQVSTDYPQSPWTPRALLGEARCLVVTGKAQRAMELLQRVRQRFPGTPEAATAVAWNTILYRLYLRAPAQPAYVFAPARAIAGATGKLKDVQALAVAPSGTLYAASRGSILLFDAAGRPAPGLPAADARAILFDRAGRPVIVFKDGLALAGGGPVALIVPKSDGSPRTVEDIYSGVLTSGGDLLVTDRSPKNIARFSSGGRFLSPFAPAYAQRLAIDAADRVVALDQDGNGITLMEHDGRLRGKIPGKGQGYQFDKPVDLAVDALGHIYVLDRNAAAVFVFSPADQPKLLAVFAIPSKSPGTFKKAVCFALDTAGRLFIYDDDAERIQVYQ
jgi:TolA-binding protein